MSEYNPLHISAAIIGLFIIITFTIAITYDILKKTLKKLSLAKNKDDHRDGHKTSIDIRILIYVDLFLILAHMVFIAFNVVFSSNHAQCQMITRLCIFLFHIGRCIMYSIFIRRIQVIYNETVFALSSIHTYLIYIIITIYFAIPFISFARDQTLFLITYDPMVETCTVLFVPPITCIMSAMDVFIAIYCLYLFVYPLWKLINARQDKEVSCKLYLVMIKYSILYISSICSAITLILFSYFNPFGFNYAIIDGLINGMILIFLHPIHNHCYKRICCIAHGCCIYLLNAPKDEPDFSNVVKSASSSAVSSPRAGDSTKTNSKKDRRSYDPSMAKQHIELSMVPAPSVNNDPISRCNTDETHSNVSIPVPEQYVQPSTVRPSLKFSSVSPAVSIPSINTTLPANSVSEVICKTPSIQTMNVAMDIRQMMKQRYQHRMSIAESPNSLGLGFSSFSVVPEIPDANNTAPHISIFAIAEEKEEEFEPAPKYPLENNISITDENNNREHSSNSCSISIVTNGTNRYEEGHNINTLNGAHVELEIKEEIEGVVDIILEELEDSPLSKTKTMARNKLVNVGSIGSLNFSNIGSFKSCSTIELEKKSSNTLRLINYESTCL